MKAVLPTSASELGHIFRAAKGHVPDTPENRELLIEVANDEAARLESDQHGTVWSARTLADGRQAWTQVRGSKIVDAGINSIPRSFNSRTGLKKL